MKPWKKPRVWEHYDRRKAAEKAAKVSPPVLASPVLPEPAAPARPASLVPKARDKRPDIGAVMVAAIRAVATKRDPEVPGALLIEAAREQGYSLADGANALRRLVDAGHLRRGERGFFALGRTA